MSSPKPAVFNVDLGDSPDVDRLASASHKVVLKVLSMDEGSFEVLRYGVEPSTIRVRVRGEQWDAEEKKATELFVSVTAEITGLVRPDPDEEEDGGGAAAEESGEECVFEIKARYLIMYKIKEGQVLSAEEIGAFLRRNPAFNVWPYLREFSDSCVGRLRLRQFTLPLFRMEPGSRTATKKSPAK